MGAALFSIILATLAAYLCNRYQAYGAMQITTSSIVLVLVVITIFLFLNKEKIVFVFAYMICEVVVILPMVLFWGIALGIMNPRESKRWFGLIGASGTCGCILAGYTVSLLSESNGVNEFSLGMVACSLTLVYLILLTNRSVFKIPLDSSFDPLEESTSFYEKFKVLLSGRQSILMTLLVVFPAIALSIIDINFKLEVRKDQQNFYDFFGLFYTYSGVAQLLVQIVFVRAILTKGGVLAALSILPSLLIFTSAVGIFFGSQDTIYVSKFITQVVFFTIEYIGLQMLFLAFNKRVRAQMNSAIDGLTRPATVAIISLLVTYTLPFWQVGTEQDIVLRLNLIVIFVCCCWLLISHLNYKEYLSALSFKLGTKKIDFDDDARAGLDPKFLEELRKSFSDAKPEDSWLLSEFALKMNLRGWNREFERNLKSKHDDLRKNAYLYLIRVEDTKRVKTLISTSLNEPEEVQMAMIDSLVQTKRKDMGQIITIFLGSKYSKVSCNAAASLMYSPDSKIRISGEKIFNEFFYSDNQNQRQISAEAISKIKDLDTSVFIANFLSDLDPKINELALHGINQMNFRKLFPTLFRFVQKNSNKALIFLKVFECGEVAVTVIDEKIRKNLRKVEINELALLLDFRLQTIIPPRKGEIESWIQKLGHHWQRDLLEGLHLRKTLKQPNHNLRKKWVHAKLVEVLERGHENAVLLAAIPNNPKFEALAFVLTDKQIHQTALLSEILSQLNKGMDFKKLFEVAKEKGEDAKSEVSEVLQGTISHRLCDEVMQVILTKPSSGKNKDYDFFFEKFSNTDSRWYKCALLLAMCSINYQDHASFVEDLLVDSVPMVRECALQTFIKFERNKEKLQIKCKYMSQDVNPKISEMAAFQIQVF